MGEAPGSLKEIARLFALVNVALADAGIASWDSKFFYQYWRPVTAIRAESDPNFYPLGAPATNTAGPNFTPPFPAYTSGHATFGGALFQMLRHFWPDETPFTFISDEFNGKKDVNGNSCPSGEPRSNRLATRKRPTHKAEFTWAYIGTSTPKRPSNKAITWLTMFSTTPSGQSGKRAHEKEGAEFQADRRLSRKARNSSHPHPLPHPQASRALLGLAAATEVNGREVSADRGHGDNDDDGDQCGDETIFDNRDAELICDKAVKPIAHA
jgi:hypothetical protein